MTRPVLHWPCAKLCPWSSLQIRLVSWEFCKKQRFKTQHFQLGILMCDSCRRSKRVSLSDLESMVSKPKNASSTASQGAGGGYLLHLPRGANHLLSQQRLDTPLLPCEPAGLRCDTCTKYLEKRIWKDGKENNGKKYSSYTATPFDSSIILAPSLRTTDHGRGNSERLCALLLSHHDSSLCRRMSKCRKIPGACEGHCATVTRFRYGVKWL